MFNLEIQAKKTRTEEALERTAHFFKVHKKKFIYTGVAVAVGAAGYALYKKLVVEDDDFSAEVAEALEGMDLQQAEALLDYANEQIANPTDMDLEQAEAFADYAREKIKDHTLDGMKELFGKDALEEQVETGSLIQ